MTLIDERNERWEKIYSKRKLSGEETICMKKNFITFIHQPKRVSKHHKYNNDNNNNNNHHQFFHSISYASKCVIT